MSNDLGDNFIRWQSIAREHFSAVCNLVLGLATGLLAFQSAMLVDGKFAEPIAENISSIAVLFLLCSIGTALWCTLNRLKDFRLTAQITRNSKGSENKKHLRKQTSKLGKKTWFLLRIQVFSFGLGAGFSVLAIFIELDLFKSILFFILSQNILPLIGIVFQVLGTFALATFSFNGIKVKSFEFLTVGGEPITIVSISKVWLLVGKSGLAILLLGLTLSYLE